MSHVRAIAFLSAVFCLLGPVQAQSADAKVRRIRTEYADAQRVLPTLRTVHRDLNDEANEGGTVVGYYTKANALRAMTITLFGETGKRVDEVYFLPGNHVFVLRSVMRYDKPFGKVVSSRQSRFYLSDDKLVRHLEGQRSVLPSSVASVKTVQQLQKDIDRYKAVLIQPNPYR